MSVVHVSVKPSSMFRQCLAVDKIEESEEQGFYEESEERGVYEESEGRGIYEESEERGVYEENSDEEEKELRFTTEAQENEDEPWDSSPKNTSRVPSESREAMYRRAMHLITARCTSTAPGVETPYGTARSSSFGVQVPQYFYIKQERPTPMPPLKAWQGYNGNVYFEPIQISSIRDFPEKSNNPYESRSSSDLHRLLMSQQQERPDSDAMRTASRNTGKTSSSLKSNRPNTKQVVLMDKKTVLNTYNDSLNDDLDIIEGTEHTGSLSVRPKSDRSFDRKPVQNNKVYNKEKICKGSVVHRLNVANRQSSAQPVFKVSGGKYSSPTNTSPLLRTQTQYSLSNQRLTTNSPDMYSQQLLPPLEQLRSAVRHMDTISKERVGFSRVRPVAYTEEIKPFIKYSQPTKRQTNYV